MPPAIKCSIWVFVAILCIATHEVPGRMLIITALTAAKTPLKIIRWSSVNFPDTGKLVSANPTIYYRVVAYYMQVCFTESVSHMSASCTRDVNISLLSRTLTVHGARCTVDAHGTNIGTHTETHANIPASNIGAVRMVFGTHVQ